jgi:hypothetical protein
MTQLANFDHAFVIPAFGDSPHLPDCIASLRAQTLATSRIVLSSSTPSPWLRSVAAAHELVLMETGQPASIAGDWNFALTATAARYITIAHQDDCYAPEYAEIMRTALLATPGTVIAFSNYREFTNQGDRPDNLNLRIKRRLIRSAFGNGSVLRDSSRKRGLLKWGNPVCCPSVTFDRSSAPGFRFSEGFRTNLDWDAWTRLANEPGAFIYQNRALVLKRVHQASETSHTISNGARALEDREMFERFWPSPIAALIMGAYRLSYIANRT